MSVPRALLLALALLQATGIAGYMQRVACEDECKRDGCADDCTPGEDCPQCLGHCPGAPTVAAPAVAITDLVRPATELLIAFDRTDLVHTSPDPREILHVPRQHSV